MTRTLKTLTVAALAAGAFAATPAAAHSTPTYTALDEYMLRSSIQGDRFEITGGRLAESKGTAAAVRSLAARLVTDHRKSLKEAIGVAHRLGISVPSGPTPSQEWELQTVGGLTGDAFDVAYAHLEVQDHKQDIEDSHTELQDGLNPSIRHLAKADLPVLRTHLKLSKQAWRAARGG